jgi:hypothetical protein
MNQVARVFVVINLFLAAGFLMAAATFLKQTTNWKVLHGESVSERERTVTSKDAEIAKLRSEIATYNSDLQQSRNKVSSLEQDKSDLSTRLKSAEDGKATAEQSTEREQGAVRIAASAVEAMKGEIAKLAEQVDRYKSDAVAAQKERDAAVTAKADAEKLKDESERTGHGLEDTIKQLNLRITGLESTLATYTGTYPPPVAKDQAVVEGTVIRYDPARNVVEINRGRKHNVTIGHQLDIVRGSNYIGEVLIDSVLDETSIGHVSLKNLGRQPQSGDTATKLGAVKGL